MTIVPLIVDAVEVPVMAAGGIIDKRGVNAAFALGAEGVYLGTRFIVSKESPANEKTKQDIISNKTEELVLFRSYDSFWRATPHKLALESKKLDEAGVSSQEISQNIEESGGLKTAMLDGNLDEGIVTVSSAISLIKDIKACKEIVAELMEDFR